jgi:integrase
MGKQSKNGRTVWSYSAGEWGANRVRVYEHGTKGLYVEWTEEVAATGLRKRVRKSLGHDDRKHAKAQADEVAAKLRQNESPRTSGLTLGELFDIYEREVTPTKSGTARAHDRRCIEMFTREFGTSRQPSTLSRREWDRFIEKRKSGKLAPANSRPGRSVRARPIEQDLTFLNAVLNWATQAGDGCGNALLDRNPLKGLKVPRESSPKRAVLRDPDFESIREAASKSPRWELFVALAADTGHRAASVRQLRWSDIDLEGQRVRWRAENDKSKNEHFTPLTPECVALLRREQARARAIGDAWVFPATADPTQCMSSNAAGSLFKRLAAKIGLPSGERYGWHSLRRRFATSLQDRPLRVLCDLGGWKSPSVVVKCYQTSDEATQRDALACRRAVPGRARVAG